MSVESIAYSVRDRCRACAGTELRLLLALGEVPLANSFLSEDELKQPEQRFPLNLVFCSDCSLVQILEDVPPEVLFRHYLYFSSFSDTTVTNAKALATRLTSELGLDEDSLVVEVASNDGYLLQHYLAAGVRVLGIEPARNIAAAARLKGVETLEEFFGSSLGAALVAERGTAAVVHANNVLAHVGDLPGFVAGLATLVGHRGVVVVEAPHVVELIDHLQFDTIYHEHLCYFSLTALQGLCEAHDLQIFRVEPMPVHGGSLRVFAGRGRLAEPSVARVMDREATWGVRRVETYASFAERVRALAVSLKEQLCSLRSAGQRIAAYGASAKGTTLLSFLGVGAETLEFVADRSTAKQGLYTPGTHIPVVAAEELVARMPDYVLLMAWNFADEILGQQAEYRRRGGRFIIPVPTPRVV